MGEIELHVELGLLLLPKPAVEEKLKELIDPDGGISRSKVSNLKFVFD